MSGITAVGFFLISLFFNTFTCILWIRILLCYVRISPLQSFARNITMLTNPLVQWIEDALPKQYKRRRELDLAACITLLLVELCKFLTIGFLFLNKMMPLSMLMVYLLADLILKPCDVLFYAILIRVIMSFINPRWHNPFADVLQAITTPLLKPIQQHVPIVSGLDISPFLALILLKCIMLFVSASLPLHLI